MWIKPFLRSLPNAESNQCWKKLSCVWEKRREWALNRRRQKGGQKVWIMKIKPVISITLEALASFVSVISDTVSCPVVFFTRLKLENSLYLWSHEICSAYKWHISLWYKTRWRIENPVRPSWPNKWNISSTKFHFLHFWRAVANIGPENNQELEKLSKFKSNPILNYKRLCPCVCLSHHLSISALNI